MDENCIVWEFLGPPRLTSVEVFLPWNRIQVNIPLFPRAAVSSHTGQLLSIVF